MNDVDCLSGQDRTMNWSGVWREEGRKSRGIRRIRKGEQQSEGAKKEWNKRLKKKRKRRKERRVLQKI